jgi:hypothetical protein
MADGVESAGLDEAGAVRCRAGEAGSPVSAITAMT